MAVLEKISSQEIINLENKYGAHNYHPLPANNITIFCRRIPL
jgi:hypothetical protein